MSNIIHVTDASFDKDVLQSKTPVLLDFWAPWCGPCKMLAPILDELSGEYTDRITVAKLDVDTNKTTSEKFGVRGIPTMMIFKNGQVVAQKIGALGKGALKQFIDAQL